MVDTNGDGFEGSYDCGIRVVIEASGVSKSSRHGAKHWWQLVYCINKWTKIRLQYWLNRHACFVAR